MNKMELRENARTELKLDSDDEEFLELVEKNARREKKVIHAERDRIKWQIDKLTRILQKLDTVDMEIEDRVENSYNQLIRINQEISVEDLFEQRHDDSDSERGADRNNNEIFTGIGRCKFASMLLVSAVFANTAKRKLKLIYYTR